LKREKEWEILQRLTQTLISYSSWSEEGWSVSEGGWLGLRVIIKMKKIEIGMIIKKKTFASSMILVLS
jgi:hypothetical protein